MTINALISNYGLFWKRKNVHWGHPKNAGHLCGYPAKAKTGAVVDFREQKGIYALYDEAYQLIYIGQVGGGENKRLFLRLKHHTRDHLADRWNQFSWFGIQRVLKSGDLAADKSKAHPTVTTVLNQIEAILIVTAEPRHNKQGGKFGKYATQYLQYRDYDALGPEQSKLLSDIAKIVEATYEEVIG